MVCELEQLKLDAGCLKSSKYDGMPKGSSGGSGLEDKIAHVVDLEREIDRMQTVFGTIPADMRDGIMDNIMYNMPFPVNEYAQLVPSLREWQRVKREFIVRFAREMRIYGKYQK